MDYLAAVEKAYDYSASDSAWLAPYHDYARSLWPQSLGVLTYTFDFRRAQHRFGTVHYTGPHPELREVPRVMERMLGETLYRAHRPHAVITASEALGSVGAPLQHWAQVIQPANDVMGVLGSNPDQSGVVLATFLPAARKATGHERRRLGHIATHLATGYRLRRALQKYLKGDPMLARIAILRHDGEPSRGLCGAIAGPADERRSTTAGTCSTPRSVLGKLSTEESLEIWQELLDGAWSVIEHVKAMGRRHLLAMKKLPGLDDPRALSEYERQVLTLVTLGHSQKRVAYELGRDASHVSRLLKRGMRKLGLQSRGEVIRFLRSPRELLSSTSLRLPIPRGLGAQRVLPDAPELARDEFVLLSFDVPEASEPKGLSPAEKDIFEMLLRGCSDREIAGLRGCSVRTVTNQVRSLFKKADVHSRAELLAHAFDDPNPLSNDAWELSSS